MHATMKGSSFHFLFFSLFLLSFLAEARKNGVYIVYMGAAGPSNGSLRLDHARLLTSVLKRRRDALVHNYRHGFSGFAARLSDEEAQSIAQKPGVVSVFADPVLQLHTTRSWDFLQHQADMGNETIGSGSDNSQSHGSDTIIGVLDTGVWPESESFSDMGMGPIPSRWKGTCVEGTDFSSSNCNKKLIGARYYEDPDDDEDASGHDTPRDFIGHGTHVASTAMGSPISGASYYGLATGTAKGGSPGSRLAVYRVCVPDGCVGSSILAGIDDAIADGVDVLSLSLGSSPHKTDFSTDPIAIGALHAAEKGIIVVCSAGNAGPDARTVVNDAPWILTVAATTIDRHFETNLLLGRRKIVIKGEGIHVGSIKKSPVYPLIYGKSAKRKIATDKEARNCNPDSLEGKKIKGKIVVCDNDDQDNSVQSKMKEVKDRGGVGGVLIDDQQRAVADTYGDFPAAIITSKAAAQIFSYIKSTRNPVATMLPTVTVTNYKPAPIVAYFSARGPPLSTRNLIKPDVAAPGVAILAAWMGNDTSETPKGQKPPLFNVLSGTSMACPHVSGIAATVKSQNPTWSPAAIISSIITTATQTNNLGAPITTETGSEARPYDYGAGQVRPSGSSQPGLVYEAGIVDYLMFLCGCGYSLTQVKLISRSIPRGFACPKDSTTALISNINYPSIAISGFDGKQSKTIERTVTNVGGQEETTYTARVEAPGELRVQVVPNQLIFKKGTKKLSYKVIFTSTEPSFKGDDAFGSITWINSKYKVRSPFVVSSGNDD